METAKKLELIDALIVDCNTAVQALTQGNYIQFCAQMVDMVRAMGVLKNGIEASDKEYQRRIAMLESDLAHVKGDQEEEQGGDGE